MGLLKKSVFFLVLTFVLVFSLLYVSSRTTFDPLTGYVVVQSGNSNDAGIQQRPNPAVGILKGQVDNVILDSNTVVDTEYAPNIVVYFINEGSQLLDYNKVKRSSEDYRGAINNIDSDGPSERCSHQQYETLLNYYDSNDNNQEDEEEFEVYTITTDSNGCYAVRLPATSYDIFI